MFDQLKKLKQLKDLQDSVKQEKEAVEKNGIKVVLNGNFDVEEIKLNRELPIEEQENILKDCLKEAKENIQKRVAKAIMGSGIRDNLL